MIGNIEIKVLGVDRGKVKLGIDAPKEFQVWRKEIMPNSGFANEKIEE